MASQALARTGGSCIQESFHYKPESRQPTKKSSIVSFISYTADKPNSRLAKEEAQTLEWRKKERRKENMLVSEQRRKMEESKEWSSASICADSYDADDKSTVAHNQDKLHQWITESIAEIVRHIGEAPFLYYIFERDVSSATPKRQRVPQDILDGAESWPMLRKSIRNIIPDGVVLVKRLDDEDSFCKYSTAPQFEKGSRVQDFDESGCTNIWGLLVQGRGVGVSACYILKTTEVVSGHGRCTHFCLTKAKCFGGSACSQLAQSWLV